MQKNDITAELHPSVKFLTLVCMFANVIVRHRSFCILRNKSSKPLKLYEKDKKMSPENDTITVI